jgi:poly(3-hydroxybutyrate) depolymerase
VKGLGLALSFVALATSGCLAPVEEGSRCAGLLGCSAGQSVGPVREDEYGPTYLPADDSVKPGRGCGQALPDEQQMTVPGSPRGYTHFTVMGTGANLTDTPIPAKAGPRTFWVRVPADYDRNRPYPLVYVGQGCGGYKTANTATLALYKGNEQAIYVALDIPEDHVNQDCYDNRDGLKSQEWEAFQLFTDFVDSRYCVDTNRIYVTGYSTGGWLANMWGCAFGGERDPRTADPRKFAPTYHVRAQAAVTGGEPDEQPPCGPVAAIWIHDVNDQANPIEGNKRALARVGRTNGCDTNYDDPTIQEPFLDDITAVGAGFCKRFKTCPAAYPVVFCTTRGIGSKATHDERAIAAFPRFFGLLAPRP